jgi:hypothetical protein
MNRALVVCLVALVVGNGLLWSGLQKVALEGAEARLRAGLTTVFGDSMAESRFPEHELMPTDYVLLVPSRPDALLLSVYAANFPRDGLGLIRAHDPGTCYVNAGWLVEGRETLRLAVDDRRPALQVYEFQRGEERRVVLSWRQPLGRVADADRPWWRDGLDRLVHGRQDFVWVRLEVGAEVWRMERRRIEDAVVQSMKAIEDRFTVD